MWPFNRNTVAVEKRTYTDTLTHLLLARAQGSNAIASAASTAAAEIASGLVSRAFAAGVVTGGGLTERLSPALLAAIGRDLILRGESLIVKVGDSLIRASLWDIAGDSLNPNDWQYITELPTPSGTQAKRTFSGSEVAHPRYSADSMQPWKGIGPFERAGLGSNLLANVESKLGQEATAKVGYFLPHPENKELAAIKTSINANPGAMHFVETFAAGYGDGRASAPQKDWVAERFGPNPPDGLIQLYREARLAAVAAAGVPVELLDSSSQNAAREGFRRFLHSTIQPLARIVEPEISKLMGASVRLDFSNLMASDIQGRARAFGSLIQGGMAIEPAMKLAGLDD